jgi:aryl carrier-like protein
VILNGYGTTETPQLASYGVVRGGRPPDIGRGAPGSELLVVDDDGRPCETGRPGRILVRSGHLVAPVDVAGNELVGIDDDAVRGLRRFATGDRGVRLVDGSVRFLGRDDGLVDIRGHRVHPAETDMALRTVVGVIDCITLVRPGPDGRRLVSYVAGPGPTPVRIRQAVARLLPAPSVPEQVVVLDRLPVTPNGKVDLERLPDPRTHGPVPVPTGPPAGVTDTLEHRLHRLVAATVGVDDFAPTDSFFDLGGSSLTMLRLHTTLRREIAPDLTVVALYENPTVRRLAQYLAASGGRALTARGGTAERAGQRLRRTYARNSLRTDPTGGGHA